MEKLTKYDNHAFIQGSRAGGNGELDDLEDYDEGIETLICKEEV